MRIDLGSPEMGREVLSNVTMYRLLVSLFKGSCMLYLCTDHNGDYEVKVHGVEISPNPVARGQSANFSISAFTGNAIAGGKLVIDVAYFGWHVHSETHDLCSETACPVLTGDFVISHSQVLPAFTPPGSYSLKMKIRDANKRQLSCFGFDFSIGFGSSVAAF